LEDVSLIKDMQMDRRWCTYQCKNFDSLYCISQLTRS